MLGLNGGIWVKVRCVDRIIKQMLIKDLFNLFGREESERLFQSRGMREKEKDRQI